MTPVPCQTEPPRVLLSVVKSGVSDKVSSMADMGWISGYGLVTPQALALCARARARPSGPMRYARPDMIFYGYGGTTVTPTCSKLLTQHIRLGIKDGQSSSQASYKQVTAAG